MNSLRHPAIHAEQLRRIREAIENTMKSYPESERREAARMLGLEHYLTDAQDELPLKAAAVLGAT